MRAMDNLGVDLGFLLETKLTGGIYTRFSSGYNVLASKALLPWQGGIALFWRGNNSYEIKETQIWGSNIISLHLIVGSTQFFVVGCYIPPSDLATLTCVEVAWRKCPAGAHPILVSNLNLDLCACTQSKRRQLLSRWMPWNWSTCPDTSINAGGNGRGG